MSHVNPESDAYPRSPETADSFQSVGVSLLSYIEDSVIRVGGTDGTHFTQTSSFTDFKYLFFKV